MTLGTKEVLVRFDLSKLRVYTWDSNQIKSATLYMKTTGSSQENIEMAAHEVTRDWKEGTGDGEPTKIGEADFNYYNYSAEPPYKGRWSVFGGLGSVNDTDHKRVELSRNTISKKNTWYSWDVKDAIVDDFYTQNWYGFHLRYPILRGNMNFGSGEFYSSETINSDNRPYIVVDFIQHSSSSSSSESSSSVSSSSSSESSSSESSSSQSSISSSSSSSSSFSSSSSSSSSSESSSSSSSSSTSSESSESSSSSSESSSSSSESSSSSSCGQFEYIWYDRTSDSFWTADDGSWSGAMWIPIDNGYEYRLKLEVKSGTSWANGFRPELLRVTFVNTPTLDNVRLRDASFFSIADVDTVTSGDELSLTFIDDSTSHDIFDLAMSDSTADTKFAITKIEFGEVICSESSSSSSESSSSSSSSESSSSSSSSCGSYNPVWEEKFDDNHWTAIDGAWDGTAWTSIYDGYDYRVKLEVNPLSIWADGYRPTAVRVTIADATAVNSIRLRDVSVFSIVPETEGYVSGTAETTSFIDGTPAHDIFDLSVVDTTAGNAFIITDIEFEGTECAD